MGRRPFHLVESDRELVRHRRRGWACTSPALQSATTAVIVGAAGGAIAIVQLVVVVIDMSLGFLVAIGACLLAAWALPPLLAGPLAVSPYLAAAPWAAARTRWKFSSRASVKPRWWKASSVERWPIDTIVVPGRRWSSRR
jgi:hypothetical protein